MSLSLLAGGASAGDGLTVVSRDEIKLSGQGEIKGDAQQTQRGNVSLTGNGRIDGSVFVVGVPSLNLSGNALLGVQNSGIGAPSPTSHEVKATGNATITGNLTLQTPPEPYPVVDPPSTAFGNRNVSLKKASDDPGDFSTIRDLSLSGSAGVRAVPPGVYRSFEAKKNTGFVFGNASSTVPEIYQFAEIDIGKDGVLEVIGPVIVIVQDDVVISGLAGDVGNPDLLQIKIAVGELDVKSGGELNGIVSTPDSDVKLSGTARINGRVLARKVELTGQSQICEGGTILPYNEPPLADDQVVETLEDNDLQIVLAATDPNGDDLTYTLLTSPTEGVLSGAPPSLTYTPNPNFNGVDAFSFRANDGLEDSNVATVTITVVPVNDTPVADALSVTTDEDTSVALVLTGSDLDLDPLTFSIASGPTNGVIDGTPPNLSYTPNPNFHGSDSFTYVANDGTVDSAPALVTLVVLPVNDAPTSENVAVEGLEYESVSVVLVAQDIDGDPISYVLESQPTNGAILGNAPNLSYVPNANFNGTDTFTYHVNDGQADSLISTVTISIVPVNDAPVGAPEVVQTDEDVAVAVVLTGSDVDGDPLTFQVVDQPVSGVLSGTAPTLTYTPNAD